MPPSKRIHREDILQAALKIIGQGGLEDINARRIARELNCSVQPIFANFKNMDDLINETVSRIYGKYKDYIADGAKQEKPYKGMGLAYIKFAKDYPAYFKVLFMQNIQKEPVSYIMDDDAGEETIRRGMEMSGFTYEQQKDFHVKVMFFTHGMAALLATGTVKMSDEEIERLLTEGVGEMVLGIKAGDRSGERAERQKG